MSTPPTADRNVALLRALADRIDTSDCGACNNLGVLYHSKGMYAEAVALFLRALAIAPRMRVARRNLEMVASTSGACDQPVAALEARVQADDGDRDARRELARLLRLIGRPTDAITHLNTLLDCDPDDALALREYGVLEQQGGDLRKAQRWYERALAVTPEDTIARLQLAEVHYHRGANEQSLRELDALLTHDAAHAEAHLLRGFVLGDMGYHDAATEAARKANELDPALETLQGDLTVNADLSHATGAPSGTVPAIPISRNMLDTPAMLSVVSNGSMARYGLGLAFRQRGYFAEARRELERAASQGEDPLLVRHALAELDLVQGVHGSARERYESLLAERGDDARLWNEHGVALHQSGNVESAADSYRKALRADPRYALAYNNLGVALESLGDSVAAREALQRAAQLDPELVRARLNLARWSLRHRDPMSALAVARELAAFHPTLADAWFEMGVALIELHRVDEARQAITTAIEHRPDHAEARYTLAQVLGTLGDHDGALRETQHALGLAPVRVETRLSVGILLQDECPESVGPLDLLNSRDEEPLLGAEVTASDMTALLPETAHAAPDPLQDARAALNEAQQSLSTGDHRSALHRSQQVLSLCSADVRERAPELEVEALRLVADAFAAEGIHGEAYERYQQVRGVLAANRALAATESMCLLARRALLGEIRSACLLGQGGNVVPLVERFGSHDTNDPDVLALLAATHAALSDSYGRRVARGAIEKLLRLDPRSPAIFHFVADAAVAMEETDLALALYRRALVLDPTRPSPRVAIARLLHKRGDYLAARLELVAALATAPRFRDARLALAAVHRDAGRPEEAVKVLVTQLEHDAADTESLVLLAESLRAADRSVDARLAIQRVRRFEPDHPMGLWMDGMLLNDQGRTRDARARWGRLIAIAPGTPAASKARDAFAAMDAALPGASDAAMSSHGPFTSRRKAS